MTAVAHLDAGQIEAELATRGFALTGPLLTPEACRAITALYDDPACFRSRVVMQRHGYGHGEYQYFSYPLPPKTQAMREALYGLLSPIATRWAAALGEARSFPPTLAEWLAR